MSEEMNIISLVIQNIKGIKAFDKKFNGESATLTGANEAGKSTVLETVNKTLTGGKLLKSNGAEKGRADIEMGEYIISYIMGKTDRMEIKHKETRAVYPAPREFLKEFIGPLSIDPMAFVKLDEKKQLEVVFALAPSLRGDLEAADKKIEGIRGERVHINTEKKRLSVEFEAAYFHGHAPADLISTTELSSELQAGMDSNVLINEKKIAKGGANTAIESQEKWIEKDRSKIAELKKQIETINGAITTRQEAIKGHKKELEAAEISLNAMEHVDTSEIMERMSGADAINDKVRANWARNEIAEKLAKETADYSEKGQELKQAEADRAKLLENAKMPLPGLSVNGGLVTYNGVPMSEICTAEKVRVGASIAVAQNPKAKIILIDDASLLDSKNLAAIPEICEGFQIIQVINDDSGDVGIFIEEGEIKKVDGKETAK